MGFWLVFGGFLVLFGFLRTSGDFEKLVGLGKRCFESCDMKCASEAQQAS